MSLVHMVDVWRLDMPHCYHQTGEIVTVGEERMVRLTHGAIVPVRDWDLWHSNVADAKRAAARRVEAMIPEIHGLAAQLRAEADAEEARAQA